MPAIANLSYVASVSYSSRPFLLTKAVLQQLDLLDKQKHRQRQRYRHRKRERQMTRGYNNQLQHT